jgi:hypothetical protein
LEGPIEGRGGLFNGWDVFKSITICMLFHWTPWSFRGLVNIVIELKPGSQWNSELKGTRSLAGNRLSNNLQEMSVTKSRRHYD